MLFTNPITLIFIFRFFTMILFIMYFTKFTHTPFVVRAIRASTSTFLPLFI